jgi:4-hydroxy-tetrahydrodipicolinate reductase
MEVYLMIKVGVVGATGKLGKDILRLLYNHNEISLSAAISRKNNSFIGKDIATLIDSNESMGTLVMDDIIAARSSCDVFIDCTNADAFMDNYDSYMITNKPIIIATTGFNPSQMERLNKLAQSVPVAICPNFSIGVYKFLRLIQMASNELGEFSDIDIIEHHHKYKRDKPSGTALKMAEIVRMGVDDTDLNIQIHSIRAGNIVGEHTIQFTTSDNERIEISHKAYSREAFSRGVIEAIKWIRNRENGLYGMEDIFQ